MTLHHHLLLRFFQFWIILVFHSMLPFQLIGQATLLIYLFARASAGMIGPCWVFNAVHSDHHAILSALLIPRKTRAPRLTKTVRSIKSINISDFCNDILSSDIFKVPVTTLQSYLETFTSTLSSLLTNMLHLKTFHVHPRLKSHSSLLTFDLRRPNAPSWKLFTEDQGGPLIFKISESSQLLFTNLYLTLDAHITAHSFLARKDYPRKLWSTLNSLLSRNMPSCLPSFSCASTLAASFLKFFDDKISLLCSKLPPPAIPPTDQSPITPPPLLSSFAPSTEEEVRRIIMSSSDTSCDLDVIPTSLLKSCLDVLIKPITIIVNMSLSEGSFPSTFKHALVKPLLKKHNLPQDELSSYRPISNLNFVSKVLERIIHARISSHLESFPSITPFQSAYRQFHSTETALLRIQNDLLLAINKQKVSALVLLDLSAAFDTIDHKILLSRLSSFYGLSSTALNLIASYLLNRTQSVSVQSHSTPPSSIFTGIPQGSVLGPLLFSLYTSPVSQIFTKASISYHLYADDTQIYISFSPNSLMTVSPCFPPSLMRFMSGSPPIAFQSIHQRLNSS